MKVEVFALLKDYFEPVFNIEERIISIEQLKQKLVQLKPATASIISACRFAVDDTFVNNEFKLNQNDTVAIIPPSSGG